MDQLTPESRAIYDLIRVETAAEDDTRYLDYRRETLDAVQKFVTDTGKQIKTVSAAVDSVRSSLTTDMEEIRLSLGDELAAVKSSLSAEISSLADLISRIPRPDPGAAADRPSASLGKEAAVAATGPDGHRWQHINRGMTSGLTTSPPVGGNFSGRPSTHSAGSDSSSVPRADYFSSGFRPALPQFDGANPKLWQIRCEEHFRRWQVPDNQRVSNASNMFVGGVATWLESYLQ